MGMHWIFAIPAIVSIAAQVAVHWKQETQVSHLSRDWSVAMASATPDHWIGNPTAIDTATDDGEDDLVSVGATVRRRRSLERTISGHSSAPRGRLLRDFRRSTGVSPPAGT